MGQRTHPQPTVQVECEDDASRIEAIGVDTLPLVLVPGVERFARGMSAEPEARDAGATGERRGV